MSEPAEQLAFRVPAGTRERIRTLAREGESMTATVLRGLAALEGQGAARDAEPGQLQGDGRLSAMEDRIAAIEAMLAPVEGSGSDYPDVVKAGALKMQAEGRAPAEIRAAIEAVCGRSPDPKHLARTLRRWAGIGAGADTEKSSE